MAYLDVTAGQSRETLGSAETDALLLAIPVSALADLTTQAALTAVPASFADLAAVQTYLVTLQAELQTIAAADFTKINAILARLRTALILTP
jgi:hypothetical protein